MIDRIQGLESALGPQADELKEKALEYAASAREMLSEGTDKVKTSWSTNPRVPWASRLDWGSSWDG